MANMWANGLQYTCLLGVLQRFEAAKKSELAQKWADGLHTPFYLGGPQCLTAGDTV